MSSVKVDLKERSYKILIGSGIIKHLPDELRKISFSKLIVIADATADAIYRKLIAKTLKKYKPIFIRIPSGEKFKTLYTASAIYDQLVKVEAHRDSLIIAFGGGVIGDLAGFVAATYMRGVSFIQVPTTLLAQVDASIGGKTGVDHPSVKNLIGSFYQPKLVLSDTDFLKTLPSREVRNGLAEVVKYGVIKDPEIISLLEKNPKADPAFWQEIVTRCARIKAEIVSKDEKEKTGLRMALNLGHTFGHAIETLTEYSKFMHGEAVALGILAASFLSNKLGLLDAASLTRIKRVLISLKLPTIVNLSADKIIKLLALDKKVKGGKVRFVLPSRIGHVAVKDNVSDKQIKSALKEIGCK